MKLITSNEIFSEILNLVELAKAEIKIASAWIKGDNFKRIIEVIKGKREKIDLEVIIRASEIDDLVITDENVFRMIKSAGGRLYLSNRLHAKFLIVDKIRAVVGSANLTTAGLSDIGTGNIEASTLYDESEIDEVQKLQNYFDDIKKNYAWEIKDDLIGFTLNPVRVNSFEFIVLEPDVEEQSYVEVRNGTNTVLGKIISISSYDTSFFANPFSTNQFHLFAPLEDFRTIFAGDKHPDWKKAAAFVYGVQRDGAVKIATCEIIGQIREGKLERLMRPFNVGDAVYLASTENLTKLMKTNFNGKPMGLPIRIGKLEGTGVDVFLDLDEVVARHMFITGTTGSGKSYFTKKFLCELLRQDREIQIFVFDPHGEYFEKLRECVEESEILYKEFEDAIIPTDPDEVLELIEQAGYGRITSRSTSVGKDIFWQLSKYIKQSLQFTGLKEKSLIEILKELNVDEQDKNKSKQKEKEEQTKQNYCNIIDNLINSLFEIYGEEVLTNQPNVFKDILGNRDKRLYIYNLRKITDPKSRINLTGLIMQEIFNKSKTEKRRRLIVLEEAHNFAPERGYGDITSGKDNLALVMARKIASEGRKFNLGLIVVSQRPAQISKYVLSQMNTQVMFRIINSSDLEAIQKYIEYAGIDTINLLPRFTTGTCIVSGISVPMPMIVKIVD